MKPRRVIDVTETPDGQRLELAFEAGRYVLRVSGVVLMTSATHDSEDAMAKIAAKRLRGVDSPRILVGGLGMGFSLRSTLDSFGPDARITVAELFEPLVGYNRGELGELAGRPLDDPRVKLHLGDVRDAIERGGWDAILLDVDNGPDAFTTQDNQSLYGVRGGRRIHRALRPGGVLVVWSAYPSSTYERNLRRSGFRVEVQKMKARARSGKGARHVLFVGDKPRSQRR